MSGRTLLCISILALCACHGRSKVPDGAAAPFDGGAGDLSSGDFGDTAALRGAFTMAGCATLSVDQNGPRCSGRAPLHLTFVPLAAGAVEVVWTFDGGAPATSQELSPSVEFGAPGSYSITLALGSAAGTTRFTGTVRVTAGETGDPCGADSDCDVGAGLFCLCGQDQDGGAGCPGGLAAGFCTRNCAAQPCAAGEICADLTRGGLPDGGAANQTFRRALCVPGCTSATDCATGLSCRPLPALAVGGSPGGAYTWQDGCFPGVLSDDGGPCLSAAGALDPAACLSGRCDPFGAHGACGSACPAPACPSGTSCGTLAGPVANSCLRSCDGAHPCSDPFLTCATPGQMGVIPFSVAGAPPGAQFCVAVGCTQPSDCSLGACELENGVSICR